MGRTVAVIPLRRGSRGVPRKNVRPLAGKPLFRWVLEAALAAPSVEEVFVLTDDPAVAPLAAELQGPRLHFLGRRPETATDEAPTEAVLLDFLAPRREIEWVVLLQATSPWTRPEDIEGALARLAATGAESLLSVVRLRRFVWSEGPGGARPGNYDPRRRPRRQDFSGLLVENGALYVFSRTGLLRTGARLHGRIALYEMPARSFLELDEPEDWVAAEALLRCPRARV